MHTSITFTRSRLQGHVNFFRKIEYLESLQELVLKKISRTVFNYNYVMLSILMPETFFGEILHIFFPKTEDVESLVEVNVARTS